MATLESFGFSPRKRHNNKNNVPNKAVNVNPGIAFIQPVDSTLNKNPVTNAIPIKPSLQQKKPKKATSSKKKNSNNTITRYFNTTSSASPITATNSQQSTMDVEMEEVHCILRKRLPILSFLDDIKSEYSTAFEDEEFEALEVKFMKRNRGRCRKYNEIDDLFQPKRLKTADIELCNVMNQFLNIKSRIQIPTILQQEQSRVNMMQEYESSSQNSDNEDENLSRALRRKLSSAESNLLLSTMAQEFLY